jgi:hypothetical protein
LHHTGRGSGSHDCCFCFGSDRDPRLADGFGYNIYNNLWGTNGIEWYPYVERDRHWKFRFSMTVP